MGRTPEANEPKLGYIRAWHALLVMFLLGIGFYLYAEFSIKGYMLADYTQYEYGLSRLAGQCVGSGLAHIALPAIIIVPWRWAQRRRQPTNAPILLAAIVFIVVTILALKGAGM